MTEMAKNDPHARTLEINGNTRIVVTHMKDNAYKAKLFTGFTVLYAKSLSASDMDGACKVALDAMHEHVEQNAERWQKLLRELETKM